MLVGTGKSPASWEWGVATAGVGTAGRVVTMQLLDGELVLSASDLTGYSACEHLTELELSVAARRDASARSATTRCSTSSPAAAASTRRSSSRASRPRALNVVEVEYPDNTVAALAEPPRRRRSPRCSRRRRDLPGHLLPRRLARPRRLPPPGRHARARTSAHGPTRSPTPSSPAG